MTLPVLCAIQLQGLCIIEKRNAATEMFLIKAIALRIAIYHNLFWRGKRSITQKHLFSVLRVSHLVCKSPYQPKAFQQQKNKKTHTNQTDKQTKNQTNKEGNKAHRILHNFIFSNPEGDLSRETSVLSSGKGMCYA